MRIGILGGTLDPIHNGHIEIAVRAMDVLGLDGVMLMPSGDPPHKPRATDKADRLAMAKLAAQAHPGLTASDIEIGRGGITYTVDTLSALAVERPDVRWTYIIGADTLNTLENWREFPHIARLCDFAVINRPGCDVELATLRANAITACYDTRVTMLPLSGPTLSSTRIRRQVAAGEDISASVPASVADYIREHGLYLCDFNERQILDRLKDTLTPHRFTHTLGVADTAERLAPMCGVDPHRARLAGLLHDCAKSMPLEEMRSLVIEHLPDLDSQELETRQILHAPAGMILARDAYGVRDPQILSAIRKHTVGAGDMSPMDALIYVADFIEPGRESFPGLEKARKLAEKDVYRAMLCCAELTARHLRARGQDVHPRTLNLISAFTPEEYE